MAKKLLAGCLVGWNPSRDPPYRGPCRPLGDSGTLQTSLTGFRVGGFQGPGKPHRTQTYSRTDGRSDRRVDEQEDKSFPICICVQAPTVPGHFSPPPGSARILPVSAQRGWGGGQPEKRGKNAHKKASGRRTVCFRVSP